MVARIHHAQSGHIDHFIVLEQFEEFEQLADLVVQKNSELAH